MECIIIGLTKFRQYFLHNFIIPMLFVCVHLLYVIIMDLSLSVHLSTLTHKHTHYTHSHSSKLVNEPANSNFQQSEIIYGVMELCQKEEEGNITKDCNI